MNDGCFSEYVTTAFTYRCDGVNCFGWIKNETGIFEPVMSEKFVKVNEEIFLHFKKLQTLEPFFNLKLEDGFSLTSDSIGIDIAALLLTISLYCIFILSKA